MHNNSDGFWYLQGSGPDAGLATWYVYQPRIRLPRKFVFRMLRKLLGDNFLYSEHEQGYRVFIPKDVPERLRRRIPHVLTTGETGLAAEYVITERVYIPSSRKLNLWCISAPCHKRLGMPTADEIKRIGQRVLKRRCYGDFPGPVNANFFHIYLPVGVKVSPELLRALAKKCEFGQLKS